MKRILLIAMCLLLVLTMAGCCRSNLEEEPPQPTARISTASENGTDDAEIPETALPGKSETEREDRHTEPTAERERQESTEKPAPSPKPTETPKPEPPPTPTPTLEPEIDIAYWVAYAKSYAVSVGLTLDSSATDCWDNPITANSKCRYLERDIQDILNRYSRDEDITDVWIWSESLRNGSYNIYIGYA